MLTTRRPGPQPTERTATIPAPVGMNVTDNAGSLPPGDAVEIVNMIRSQFGLRSRSGYREWVTGLGDEVRTLIGFQGSIGTEDRLFACLSDGIYNVTASTGTPAAAEYSFGTADANSGKVIATGFTKLDGTHALLLCDESNGYIWYDENGDVWTKPVAGAGAGEIDGADPDDFVFVTIFKKRPWFVQKDSSLAWYLPVDSITGTVEPFDFGPHFRHGGTLVGLWSWTGDAGIGIDDHLVAISSAGDLVVYAGTDPSSAATFGQVGIWYLGQVPAGRRICTDFGGELLILSSLGVIPISRLSTGGGSLVEDSYASRKISPALGQELTDRGTDYGWDLRIHPEDKTLVIVTPDAGTSDDREQWALSTNGQGWAQHLGVPMNCVESWKGKFYFGDVDGRVCINDGDVDNNQLTGSSNAVAIEWSVLTGFTDLGTPANKSATMAKPLFITDGTVPNYAIEARYDYDLSSIGAVPFSAQPGTLWVWGTAIWGSSIWGSGRGTAGQWRGTSGIGSSVAIALKGSSQARTTLAHIEVTYVSGGTL
ncbi:MAG: Myxococcus phage Mx8 [Pseudomonadota bacterium]